MPSMCIDGYLGRLCFPLNDEGAMY